MGRARVTKWALAIAISVGEAVYALAKEFRQGLDPRLPAGLIDGLAADVRSLRDDRSGTVAQRTEKKSATLTQREAAHQGRTLAKAIRKAVKDSLPNDKALQKAFGVGVKMSIHKVATIDAALATILDAAAKNPEATREVGILPEDLARVQTLKDALRNADQTGDVKRVSSKAATSDRDATQGRVEAASTRIIGVAGLAFVDKPELVKQFVSLIPGHVQEDDKDHPKKDKDAKKPEKDRVDADKQPTTGKGEPGAAGKADSAEVKSSDAKSPEPPAKG